MVNNAERLDPLGSDPDSVAIDAARAARRLTALDEGRAFRHKAGALVVVRVERYGDDPDPSTAAELAAAHRAAWRTHGAASLDATWRERWRERDLEPGWIEATWVEVDERPSPLHAFRHAPLDAGPSGQVDWYRIEDHTVPPAVGVVGRLAAAAAARPVAVYEHLTLWADRTQVTLTLRRPLALEGPAGPDAVARAAEQVVGRL